MATKINNKKEKEKMKERVEQRANTGSKKAKEKDEMKKRIEQRARAGKKMHNNDIDDTVELIRRIESRKKPEVTTYSKNIDVSKKCGDKTLFNISFNYKTRLSGKKLFPLTESNFEKKEKILQKK